jgi:hypothetical protein
MQICDYKQGQANHILFIKRSSQGKVMALIVYVDDIVVTINEDDETRNLKNSLAKKFEIKDFDNSKYFLGIEVARSKHDILTSNGNILLIFSRKQKKCLVKPLIIQ